MIYTVIPVIMTPDTHLNSCRLRIIQKLHLHGLFNRRIVELRDANGDIYWWVEKGNYETHMTTSMTLMWPAVSWIHIIWFTSYNRLIINHVDLTHTHTYSSIWKRNNYNTAVIMELFNRQTYKALIQSCLPLFPTGFYQRMIYFDTSLTHII